MFILFKFVLLVVLVHRLLLLPNKLDTIYTIQCTGMCYALLCSAL